MDRRIARCLWHSQEHKGLDSPGPYLTLAHSALHRTEARPWVLSFEDTPSGGLTMAAEQGW
jgi:hypothetical protein